jgi:hypothetical protein
VIFANGPRGSFSSAEPTSRFAVQAVFVLAHKLREAAGSNARPHDVTRNSANCDMSDVLKCSGQHNKPPRRWGRGKSLSLLNKSWNAMLSLQRFPNDFEDMMTGERDGPIGLRPACDLRG